MYSESKQHRRNKREGQRKKEENRAILRGEEVANQPMMGESNAIANNIDII